MLSKDEFRTAALEKTRTMDILDFVDSADVDERYFESRRAGDAGGAGAAKGDRRPRGGETTTRKAKGAHAAARRADRKPRVA